MITLQKSIKEEVQQIIHSMIEGYGRKDVAAFSSPYLQEERVLSIGTGEEEWMFGLESIKAFLKRDFEQSGEIHISYEIRHLEVFGDTVCCALSVPAAVEVDGGIFRISGRFTLTLKRIDESWKILQSHFSAPLSGQSEGHSFGIVSEQL